MAGSAYSKPWRSVDDQVELLISRGMQVRSAEQAAGWLNVVGYYRMSGYWYPYRELVPEGRLDRFTPGATFDRVVAMRVRIGHTLGQRGAFAHEDPRHLDARFAGSTAFRTWHERINQQRDRSREDFVTHFRNKYDGRLPVWVVTEIADFGALSRLYSGMKRVDRDAVAETFQVVGDDGRGNGAALAGWLRQLNTVRNIVAHHSRLWNRNIGPRPPSTSLRGLPDLQQLTQDQLDRLFGPLSILALLLHRVSPGTNWTRRINKLITDEMPATGRRPAEMGFPDNWQALPLWRSSAIGSGGH